MLLVHPAAAVADETMFSPGRLVPLRADSVDESADELARFVPVWNGALHEFRNHLTVLLAATTELRASLPPSAALEVAETVLEADRNVQNLSSLIAQLDAAIKSGEPLISDLDEIIERALRIAAPALGRHVSVSVNKGRKTGIRNRGSALESMLSALIVDLARAGETKAGDRPRRLQLQIHVEVGRGSLLIEIESSGPRPSPGSWRLLLANELAAKLDAVVTSHSETTGYVVQFR